MCNATHWKRAVQTLSQALAEVEFMRGVGEEVVVVVGGGGLFGRRKVNSSQG